MHTGLDAIVRSAVDSGIAIAAGVPGFPVTAIMERLFPVVRAEWSVNERVALEIALGASVSGNRALVVTKHVGMNVLADPLVTSATHTIGAGVVIIAGDDPGAAQSQNEQDSRFYGLIAEVPVLDPSTPRDAYDAMHEAFCLSERVRTPVIVRITNGILAAKGDFGGRDRQAGAGAGSGFDASTWELTSKGRHARFHLSQYPVMVEYSENSDLNRITNRGSIGIISSGHLSDVTERVSRKAGISHFSLCTVNPLPSGRIHEFIRQHKNVLVVEETEPVIEMQLGKRIYGKLTGHLPYGAVGEQDIVNAIASIRDGMPIPAPATPETIAKRGPRALCDGCPFIPLYNAIKKLGAIAAGDMGCVILTGPPQMSLIRSAFALGSAIGTASGFGGKGIALIGDYGLIHSGFAGLINAVYNRHDVLVIVLQNEMSAMTGGQPVPDVTPLIKACVPGTETLEPDDADESRLENLLRDRLSEPGVSVIVARGRCPEYRK